MPIKTIKTDGSLFDPQKIKEDFEAVSNVRVTRIVMSGDGVTDIHYEEIGKEDPNKPLIEAIQKAFDALSDIEQLARERPRVMERKVSRRFGTWSE